jgi:hypothetical protein
LLLSAPAFAQDKTEYKPDLPPNNMQNTVIPKSGGTQTPATTPTKAGETTPPDATEQTSIPNAAPAATTTQTTGQSNQGPTVKKMNEDEKKKIETEGK